VTSQSRNSWAVFEKFVSRYLAFPMVTVENGKSILSFFGISGLDFGPEPKFNGRRRDQAPNFPYWIKNGT
jgi:hypothetical protein